MATMPDKLQWGKKFFSIFLIERPYYTLKGNSTIRFIYKPNEQTNIVFLEQIF